MAGVYCIVICKNAARRASFSFSFSFSSSLISSFSFFPFYSSVPCLLCKLFLIFLFLLLLLLFCPLPPALVLFLFLFVVTPDHKQCEKKYRNALETAPKKKVARFRYFGRAARNRGWPWYQLSLDPPCSSKLLAATPEHKKNNCFLVKTGRVSDSTTALLRKLCSTAEKPRAILPAFAPNPRDKALVAEHRSLSGGTWR